jgi:hypothetical protein
MKETLRLNIPAPCTEDWGAMLPEEKGRHCRQCCKTVVDFTGMTDEEVLGFFKDRASGVGARSGAGLSGGEGVCGRFFADQLARELAPAPIQRNGVKGWQWVVASALMLGKGPDGGRAVKPAVEVKDIADSRLMGKVAAHDSVAEMPADTVTAVPIKRSRDEGFMGLVKIVPDTPLYSRKPMDTVSRIKALADTVVSILKDTVAAVVTELQQDDLLKVYPNPVLRGGVMRLAWRGEAGTYSVAFLNLHGQITQERVVEVGGKGQVDEWAVPNGLAAGVYFLRMARPGEKGYTVEVLVQ